MKIGYFAPEPGSRTGVADYAAALARALAPHADIEWNRPGDVNLYHTGNNQLHRGIYEEALRRPGVAVIHDAVLHHFFLGSLDERRYVEEFVYNYGEWHRELAGRLWQERSRSAVDSRYFRYPMLKRIAAASRAIVVHNPAAAAMVREHVPQAEVIEIPHLYAPGADPAGYEIERVRAGWNLPADAFVFGVFGHLRESKRLMPLLRVFGRLRYSLPCVRLVVAGPFASPDLERAAGPLLSGPGIIRYRYTPEAEFETLARAVDACVNLRYPPAGETSGIAIRLMGAAKPVLLTEGGETSRYPADACVRVPPGPAEEDALFDLMSWLARFPGDARAVGHRAAAHIREHHVPEAAASAYLAALRGAKALVS